MTRRIRSLHSLSSTGRGPYAEFVEIDQRTVPDSLDYLDRQRRHILVQLEGLSDSQLRQPVVPSGWSCLGLIRHLTLSDERYWFEVVVAGGSLDFWPEGVNADWQVDDREPTEIVVDAYRAAIKQSNDIIAARSPGSPVAKPEDWWESAGISFPDVRSVILHVLAETAVHAGHLDVVRELLDGRQYIVL